MREALLRLGTTEPPPPRRVLEAGALRCVLEAGALRHITWRGVEVLRGIAYLLRDRDWGTPSPLLGEPAVEQDGQGFRVRFDAQVTVGGARFRYAAEILGDAAGRLDFAATGRAEAPVVTNRGGFVLLHPAHFAGLKLDVTHTDGSVTRARFPEPISPSQPVLDIRAIRCAPIPGLDVTCSMEAELPQDPRGRFEMEDQRNWSDASFKTYVGSLRDPWPYELAPGRDWRQRVTLGIAETAAPAVTRRDGTALRLGGDTDSRLPRIGLGVPQGVFDPALPALLRPAWLVVEATPTADLVAAAALARASDAKVQLELVLPLHAPPAQEIAEAARRCAEAGLRVDAVLPCPAALMKSYQPSDTWPDLPPLAELYALARQAFPLARIGGGMVTYFTELNRKRPDAGGIDFISHTTAPIVHAADDASVMETLESLPHMARTVRAIWPGVPHRIGPSALAMRSNPYGAALVPNPDRGRIAIAGADPRQDGLFAAAWTIGYAARLAPEGVAMLALHASHGPSGVVMRADTPWREAIRDARVLPVFHALRALARAGGCSLIPAEQSPAGIAALAWREARGRAMALANLTDAPISVALPGTWHGHLLDIPRFAEAVRDPLWLDRAPERIGALTLGPYATAFLAEAAP